MAPQAENSVNHAISPQVISGVFVQQYYHILHESPDQVHKFYQDTSILGRQDSNGTLVSVTTLQEINEKIMAVDFKNCLTEIETADAQLSHKDGVLIVVTGSLTSSKGVCRRFTQTFFLAPQESGGYFVLNDVFRFIAERPQAEINHVVVQENEENQNAKSASETETTPVDESLISDRVEVENNITEEQVLNDTTVEKNVPVKPPVQDVPVKPPVQDVSVKPPVQVAKEDANIALVEHHPPAAPTPTDVTKKSYASIVKVMKEGPPAPPVVKPSPSLAKTNPAPKSVTKAVEGQVLPSAKVTQVTAKEAAPTDKNVAENNSPQQGYSVYVKNLAFNVTVQMVEEEFKKFGVIKPGGIQVRNRADGFCFGFIEYESQQSMQAAIKASPVRMGENEVCVEEKRTTTRVVNGVIVTRGGNGGGGRFQSGRGGYRGDNFRGRGGGYVNNGSYRSNFINGRNDESFNSRNDGGNLNRRDGPAGRIDGEGFNSRMDDESFNRRNSFRTRNELSGRGRWPPQGNGYHHNGSDFHPSSRPFQRGVSGRFTRVNGPKQTPVAA